MSTSISGRFKALGLAGGISALLVLGCLPQLGGLAPSTVADAQRAGRVAPVRVRFGPASAGFGLPGQSFRAQSSDIVKVNKVRLTVLSADGTFRSTQVVTLSLSNNEATFTVPFGLNFVIMAQGLNDNTDVPGVYVAGYFNIADANAVNVVLTQQTTPVAEILRYLMVKAPVLAGTIDLAALQVIINTASTSIRPSMIDPAAFGQAIIANKGLPNKPLATSRFDAGRISGVVTGLAEGEVAIITSSDPASRPFIMVGTAVVGGAGATTDGIPYTIDNVVPGTWTVRLVGSNSGADYPEQIVTLGSPYIAPTAVPSGSAATATAKPTATPTATATTSAAPSGITLPTGFTGPTATVNFTLSPTVWKTSAINVSGNVGISDQPDVTIDGIDDIHAVWRQDFNPDLVGNASDAAQDTNPSGAVYYSRWNGSNWSRENRNISGFDQQGCREPAIVIGVDRLPDVVWSGLNGTKREIRHTHFDGSAWSRPSTISNGTDDSFAAVSPDLAVDKINGHLYAVWQGGDGPYPYFSEFHGTAWTTPSRVSSTAGTAPRVATGYDGSIHIAWISKDGLKIHYDRFINNAWDPVTDLPISNLFATPAGANALDMTVDRSNRVHLMWRSHKNLAYLFSSAGTWTEVESVNTPPVGSDVASQAVVQVDPAGNINTLWRDSTGAQTIFYRRRTNRGWQAAEGLGTPALGNIGTIGGLVGADRPLLVSDSKGRLHAFWSHRFANDPASNKKEFDILHLIREVDKTTK